MFGPKPEPLFTEGFRIIHGGGDFDSLLNDFSCLMSDIDEDQYKEASWLQLIQCRVLVELLEKVDKSEADEDELETYQDFLKDATELLNPNETDG